MIARACGVALLCLVLADAAAVADENKDLDLIPDGARSRRDPAPAAPAGAANQRIYLEDAFTATARRGDLLVPFPPPEPADLAGAPVPRCAEAVDAR